ncbi:co-chaperone GroES [Kangiella sp. TOML190]|uniref:co-chaperone GroES n=1 Tax=Kangiella sp. TOML190 TaxID=2931351 RepID=UPI00203FA1F2|nr:co-chaperone GroES [Kangiella sp. TOML190]
MSLRPLHDRVVVKRIEEEALSAGGIVIPDNAKEKANKGTVIAVGNGKALDNGDVRAVSVNEGDVVLFGQYAGQEVKVDGDKLLILKEDEIFAVIEA